MSGRRWTNSELQTLRSSKEATFLLAARLHRSPKALGLMRSKLRLTFDRRAGYGPEFEAFLRQYHAMGWSDGDIADAWGGERHTVGRYREKLGLASNAGNERHLSKVAKCTKRMLDSAGCRSLAQLKSFVLSVRAVHAGWPAYCTPLMVLVLESLHAGAHTRREICVALGRAYVANKPIVVNGNKSVIMELVRHGAVKRLGRLPCGHGRGKTEWHYQLLIRPTKPRTQMEAA